MDTDILPLLMFVRAHPSQGYSSESAGASAERREQTSEEACLFDFFWVGACVARARPHDEAE